MSAPDNEEQSRRFIEAAKKHEADSDSAELDRIMGRLDLRKRGDETANKEAASDADDQDEAE